MKPLNVKSLFVHLCDTMDKLDKGEVDVSVAATQAKLVGQCVNLLNYELKRAVVIDSLYSDNSDTSVREIEMKNFDSLPL